MVRMEWNKKVINVMCKKVFIESLETVLISKQLRVIISRPLETPLEWRFSVRGCPMLLE